MPTDLNKTLDELHRQLARTKPIDAETRAHLQAAMDEVREVLAKTASGNAPVRAGHAETVGLIDRLRTWVERVELDHPTLSAGLADLIEGLRKL